MKINRSFKEFKFRHRNNENQIIYTSKKVKTDEEIINLIDNFLIEKNSFIFESVEKGKIRGRYTIFCLLYTSPSPRDTDLSRMPSSA